MDWAGLMRAGLHALQLHPDAFWKLSPAELALMMGEGAGPRPLGRSGLEELMTRFPDPGQPKDDSDG